MSKTIDERVVSMEFDNSRFEKNVSTTMSTLDKLKQKLNLSGASKGLENVSDAAKRCDISPLSRGVETVKARFSAMEVMAVTALVNITNSAVNAGKRLVSAFTIDPIKSGFQEYETQINAIQTILANTESKGTTLEQVNTALDELNKYADKTIYNFTEMTRNIGTFTAAGIDLDTSVSAIQGIANLAAVSGSTSQQASVAMYQLSQALASGTVKLMDWNSVVNAGMGGEVFQNALKKTSELLGTGAEAAIEATGSFRESLSKGWLTAEVLTETLKKFTTSGANEYLAEYTGLSKEFIDSAVESAKAQYGEAEAIEKAAAAIAEKSGKSVDEVRSTLKLAQTAEDAATKVKTFSQLMDTLKESAQSGWTQTWEILIGDFGQAKELFTGISDAVGGFINKMSDSRNELLGGVFGDQSTKSWNSLTKSVNEAGVSTDKFKEKLVELGKSHGVLTDEMIQEAGSFEKTLKQGWLSADIVAEALDSLSNGTIDATKALNEYTVKTGDCLWNIAKEHKTTWQEIYELNKDIINDPNLIYPDQILKLNSVTGESIKLTEEQVKVLQALSKEAQTTGSSMETLIKKMDRPSGREFIIDSFKNFCEYIRKVAAPVKEAWESIFPPKSMEERQEALYKIIKSINKFTKKLNVSEGTFNKLKRTFKGLFAILDIIKTVVGGPLVYAFKGICKVLGMADVDILSVTASVGDAIVAFRDWINEHNLFAKAFEIILPYLEKAADGIKTWFDSLKDSDNIARDFVLGIVNGLKAGIQKLWNAACEIGKTIYNAVCDFLEIHSPSLKGFKIAYNFILGIVKGIKDIAKKLWDTVSELVSKWVDVISEKVKNIDWSKVFDFARTAAIMLFLYQVYRLLKSLADIPGMISDVGEGITNALKGVTGALKGLKNKFNAEAFKSLAIAVAILSGCIWLLSKLDWKEAWKGAVAVAGIIAILVVAQAAMVKAAGKFGEVKLGSFALALLAIGASVLLLVSAFKKLDGINWDNSKDGLLTLLSLMGSLAVAGVLLGKFAGSGGFKTAVLLLATVAALKLLMGVLDSYASLDWDSTKNGLKAMGVMALGILAFISIIGLCTKEASVGGAAALLLVTIGVLYLLIDVMKRYAELDWNSLKSGIEPLIGILVAIGIFVTAISAFSKGFGAGLGAAAIILAITLALKVLADSFRKISNIKNTDGIALAVLSLIVMLGGIILIFDKLKDIDGKQAAKALGALAAALAVLVVVVAIFGFIPTDMLIQGAAAVAALMLALGGALWMAGKFSSKSAIAGMLIMTAAIAALGYVMTLLQDMPIEQVLSIAGALTVLMFALGGAVALAGKFGSLSGGGGIALVAVGLTLLVGALFLLCQVDYGKVWSSVGAIVALAVVLGVLMGVASAFAPGAALLSGILLSLSAVILSVGVAAIAFAGALYIASLALPLFANGLTVLVEAVLSFYGSGWKFVGMAALMALGLTMLGIGLLALTIPLAVISVSIALLGVAVLVTGVGVLAFAAALYVVGLALPVIGTGLVALGIGLNTFIMTVANAHGYMENFKNVMDTLGTSVLLFLAKMAGGIVLVSVALGLAGIAAVILGAGLIVLAAAILIAAVAAGIFAAALVVVSLILPVLADGLSYLITTLSSCKDSMDDFKNVMSVAGTSIVVFLVKLAGGLTLVGLSCVVLGAGLLVVAAALVVGAVALLLMGGACFVLGAGLAFVGSGLTIAGNGIMFIADAIVYAIDAVLGAFGTIEERCAEIGTNIVEGLANGITNAISAAVKCIKNLASSVIEGFCELLGIESPSKIFAKLGEYIVQGLTRGIDSKKDDAEEASKNLGESVINGLRRSEIETGITDILKRSLVSTSLKSKYSEGGSEGANSFLSSFSSSINNGEGLNLDLNNLGGLGDFSSIMGANGSEGANSFLTNFNTSMNSGEGLNLDFNNLGGLGDFSSIMGENGFESGQAFNLGVSDGMNSSGESSMNSALSSMLSEASASESKFIQAGSNVIKAFGNGVESGTENIKNTMSSVLTGVIDSISVKRIVVVNAGRSIVMSLANGFKSEASTLANMVFSVLARVINVAKGKLKEAHELGRSLVAKTVAGIGSAFSAAMSGAISRIRKQYMNFYDAGKYLVQGFAKGIELNSFRAEIEAESMAKTAYQAAKDALAVNSPSKVFRELGTSVPEGFAMGIGMLGSSVKSSVVGMADTAISGTKDAIARIANVIDSDIDAQPTIRPVLDLSDISAGASTINSMFGLRPSVGVLSNVGAISSMMNNGQNGTNADVISAIKDLGKKFDSSSGNTYQINGISYSEDSDVSDAIKTLVKAAKIERRT